MAVLRHRAGPLTRPRPPVEELAAALLRRGASLRIKARGGSMWPCLRDGDVVHVQPTPAPAVHVGDIVCYAGCRDRLVLHRVVRVDAHMLAVKGDALSYAERVTHEAVLGHAVALERHGRVRRLDGPWARRRARLVARWLTPVLPMFARAVDALGRARSRHAGG